MTRFFALLRYLFFCLFFAVGLGAIGLSILSPEIEGYFRSEPLAEMIRDQNGQILIEISNVESKIRQVEDDPAVLERLSRRMLGKEPEDSESVFPKISREQLEAVQRTMLDEMEAEQDPRELPDWLKRCCEPSTRQYLFYCGAGLVLVAFVCFGTVRKKG